MSSCVDRLLIHLHVGGHSRVTSDGLRVVTKTGLGMLPAVIGSTKKINQDIWDACAMYAVRVGEYSLKAVPAMCLLLGKPLTDEEMKLVTEPSGEALEYIGR